MLESLQMIILLTLHLVSNLYYLLVLCPVLTKAMLKIRVHQQVKQLGLNSNLHVPVAIVMHGYGHVIEVLAHLVDQDLLVLQ